MDKESLLDTLSTTSTQSTSSTSTIPSTQEIPLQESLAGALPPTTSIIQLTYSELNEKSNRLARHLQSKGIEPGTIVAIMVERSIEMIIGLLGILKAGGAYLPIDPEYPKERINYILKDSNTKIVLKKIQELNELHEIHESKNLQEAKESKKLEELGEGIEIIDIQTIYKSFTSADPQSPITNSQPSPSFPNNQSPAYIIYTSGTTGKP
ncbi:MAG: AMP-binding protein, partial [bacterium]|nr:AMP-binding protein [bacterium]